jgi:carbonic anhydrase/acetyltransferase-like protein (isoleucine patch superfamily)
MLRTVGLAGVLTLAVLAGALAPAAAGSTRGSPHAAAAGEAESPCPYPLTRQNRPVAPRGAPPETATFTDPTAEVEGAEQVRVAEKDYIAPFTTLRADDAEICIEDGSNTQDNTLLEADDASINLGRHAIMAHGSSTVADDRRASIAHRSACDPATGELPEPGPDPALMQQNPGESAGDFAERRGRQALSNALAGALAHYDCDEVPGFISFNARNESHVSDGALVGATSRLSSGVILRPGYSSYPGKSLDSQRQADTPGPPETHDVRFVNSGDIVFMEGVLHVNECLAKGYSGLYYTDPSSVRGVNRDPGDDHHHCTFNHDSEAPTFGDGPRADPNPPKDVRIVGDARFTDRFSTVMRNISDFTAIRADEGEPFHFGSGVKWGPRTTMHALEHTVEDPEVGVDIGNRVVIGERAVIHGGGRRARAGGPDPTPTRIQDRSVINPWAVVFRSFVEPDTVVGRKAILVGYNSQGPGEVIRDRCVKFLDTPRGRCAYLVEW